MKLSRKEKEVFWFYGLENFLTFIQMVLVFVMFVQTEDLFWIGMEFGLSLIVVINELRSKL